MAEKKQSIGALWIKQVNGKQLLSGSVEIEGKTVKISCWANDYKKEDKHPDYKIYLDTYEKPAANNTASAGKVTDKTEVVDKFYNDVEKTIIKDDLPF